MNKSIPLYVCFCNECMAGKIWIVAGLFVLQTCKLKVQVHDYRAVNKLEAQVHENGLGYPFFLNCNLKNCHCLNCDNKCKKKPRVIV
ncbi:hypothetical protein C5167_016163 [Papaver somniferum]|nr:hypothetical protein C5167_016163 [Papaver somniferum]